MAKNYYYSNLVSSSSDNTKQLWQIVNELLHRRSFSPLTFSAPGTISLADSFASFFTDKISKLRLSLASKLPYKSSNTCLLLQHLLISPLSPPPLNPKSIRFFLIALTSNLIPTPSQTGFSKNVHLFLSSQSLILSICHSPLASSTSFSKNRLFLNLSHLTILTIHNSLSLSLPAQDLPFSQIFPTIDYLPDSGLTPRLYDWSVSSEHLGFYSARNARIASAVLATAIPSVGPSVRLSVTRRYCVKTTARSTVRFAPLDSKMYLVL